MKDNNFSIDPYQGSELRIKGLNKPVEVRINFEEMTIDTEVGLTEDNLMNGFSEGLHLFLSLAVNKGEDSVPFLHITLEEPLKLIKLSAAPGGRHIVGIAFRGKMKSYSFLYGAHANG